MILSRCYYQVSIYSSFTSKCYLTSKSLGATGLLNEEFIFCAYPQAEMAAICPTISIHASIKAGNSPRSEKSALTGCPPFNPGRVISSERHKPAKKLKRTSNEFNTGIPIYLWINGLYIGIFKKLWKLHHKNIIALRSQHYALHTALKDYHF